MKQDRTNVHITINGYAMEVMLTVTVDPSSQFESSAIGFNIDDAKTLRDQLDTAIKGGEAALDAMGCADERRV